MSSIFYLSIAIKVYSIDHENEWNVAYPAQCTYQ